MRLMNVTIDTTEMSFEDVDKLVSQLRKVRERKGELRSNLNLFRDKLRNLRADEGMVFVNKHTGEVLNPNDWELYDETTHSIYHEYEREEEQ